MKKFIKYLFLCALCTGILIGTGATVMASERDTEESGEGDNDEEVTEPETKVLMIGNSFTKQKSKPYGVGSILQEVAEANHKKLSVTTIAYNNAYLSYYAVWSGVYKGYYEEVLAALKSEQYDYIILQEQTKAAIEQYEEEFFPSTKQLCTLINAYQNKAKILLYETASYVDGTKTVVDGVPRILTLQEFQQRILYGYTELQNTLNLEMIPVGMQIHHANLTYPMIGMWDTDLKHPSYAGYYIAAICTYQKIYGENPIVVTEELSHCNINGTQFAQLNTLIGDSIILNKNSLTLAMDETDTLIATVVEAEERKGTVLWKSLNSDIAIVDANTGKVTGVAEGNTGIIAETSTGLMAVCCVTVENTEPAQLRFGKKYYQVSAGDKIQLLPKMKNWQVGDVCKWSSSNKSVATVSSKGTVTAKKMGKAVIKVKSSRDSSVSASYTLYVTGNGPTNLVAKVSKATTTGGKIKLSWRKVYGATQYRVYRYNSSTKTYEVIGTSKTTAYIDSAVKTNTNYYYKVSAMAANNVLTESELSSKVNKMILGPVAPKVTATSSKYIKLTWKRNKKATGYVIYRSTKKSSGYKKIATLHSNKSLYYYDNAVKKGKTYYYRMKSYKETSSGTTYSAYSGAVKGKAVKK